MRTLRHAILAACLVVFAAPAWAADIVGLSLPLTSRYEPIANRLEFGANLAVADRRAAGQDLRLSLFDDHCEPERAPEAVEQYLAAAVSLVAGPLCFDVAAELVKALNSDPSAPPIPVISLGTRNALLQRLRDHRGLPLYTIGHHPDAEARAILDLVLPSFDGKPFAIADDGSAHGRGLSDQIRLLGEREGFKPIALAGFRPLQTNQKAMLRQLERSGTEALIINGPPEDVVTIIRNMKELGLEWPVAVSEQAALLAFAIGDERLDHEIVLVHETLPPVRDADALVAKIEGLKLPPDRSLFEGYALTQVAAQAAEMRLRDLSGTVFDTIYGPVRFAEDGLAVLAPFELYRWNGRAFVSGSNASGG